MLYKKPDKLRNAVKTDWGSRWGESPGPATCQCPFPAFVG